MFELYFKRVYVRTLRHLNLVIVINNLAHNIAKDNVEDRCDQSVQRLDKVQQLRGFIADIQINTNRRLCHDHNDVQESYWFIHCLPIVFGGDLRCGLACVQFLN